MITTWTHTWNRNAKTQTQNHKNRSRSWPEVEKGAREGGPVVAERRKSRLLAKPQMKSTTTKNSHSLLAKRPRIVRPVPTARGVRAGKTSRVGYLHSPGNGCAWWAGALHALSWEGSMEIIFSLHKQHIKKSACSLQHLSQQLWLTNGSSPMAPQATNELPPLLQCPFPPLLLLLPSLGHDALSNSWKMHC